MVRGRFLLALLATLGAAVAAAQDSVAPGPKHFALVPTGEGTYAAIAKDGDPAALGNAGFVIGSDAVLVVDTFATPAAAEELASEIRKLTPLPVKWVVNTHYHLDHVGGNSVFTSAGARVVAEENVRAWIRTENLKWRKEITAEDRETLSRLVLPDLVYRDGLTIWLGDRKVDILSRPGHTGGDSIVFVPSANVLYGGDLIWKNTVPNLIDASTEAWVNTIDGFLQEHPAATFVPGHGDVGKALDVRYFRDYLSGLRIAVARGLAEGKSGKALAEAILTNQQTRYGTWKWFDAFGPRNIELTEQELKGVKKLPPPAR
ncbi:MAG TPA: MBL fold metallo-hydrolase [Thermoanaerobaculia bacterium]|nr:MBL fold metallo-hydrolase [Thermoanaerobaculia bacterium]